MTDKLTEQERDKYNKVWSLEDYGDVSPSEQLGVHILLASPYFRIPSDSTDFRKTITDFGSGCGRTSLRLSKLGYTVRMVDIAHNSYCKEVREVLDNQQGKLAERKLMFYQMSLWDLKGLPKSNYGICCDVMEHIPTEKVDDVLRQISIYTKSYTLFQISCINDTFSDKLEDVGDLHLTIKPPSWWKSKLSEHFDVIEGYAMFKKLYVAICKKK